MKGVQDAKVEICKGMFFKFEAIKYFKFFKSGK